LIADRDDMVVKAMAWALRELAKRDPAAVTRFLKEEGDNLAPASGGKSQTSSRRA